MKKQKVSLALDIGSQSVRAILFSDSFSVIYQWQEAISVRENGNEIEHDAEEILNSCRKGFQAAKKFAKENNQNISSAGLSLQRSCALLVDNNGKAQSPLLSWRDLRGAGILENITATEKALVFQESGIPASAHFLAPKWASLLEKYQRQELFPIALDGYLVQGLTQSASRKISAAMAQRSMLLSIKTLDWSKELSAIFALNSSQLPEIQPEVSDWGSIDGIPLRSVIGDQQSACRAAQHYGADALLNIGSIASIMFPVEVKAKRPEGYLFDVLYCQKDGKQNFAIEATNPLPIHIFQSLEEDFGLNSKEVENFWSLARNKKEYSPRPLFAPLGGVTTPVWRTDFKNLIFQDETRKEITLLECSLLENLSFSIAQQIEELQSHGLQKDAKILCGGGYAQIDSLVESIASLGSAQFYRTKSAELSALGAALLASNSEGQLCPADTLESIPSKPDPMLAHRYAQWKRLREIALGANIQKDEVVKEIQWKQKNNS